MANQVMVRFCPSCKSFTRYRNIALTENPADHIEVGC